MDERIDEVGAALMAASGGASLCSFSRSGGRVDGVKYLEGRLAALSEVRRRTGDELQPELLAVAAAWRHALTDDRDRARGSTWVAYRAGGVDELDELLDRLTATPD